MPCWVVPAVAADFWGVSVEQVLAEVAAGRVATQDEGGLLFVAVGPPAEASSAAGHIRAEARRTGVGRRSLAWSSPGSQPVVTPAERDALLAPDDAPLTTGAELSIDVPESIHDEGEPEPLDDGPDACAERPAFPGEIPQWESIRSRIGRTRTPPPRPARDAA